MLDPNEHQQPSLHILAGVLAHLAQYMKNGCPRSAYLAAMLLEQIAAAPATDDHLRRYARQLVEILERSPTRPDGNGLSLGRCPTSTCGQPSAARCAP